MHCCCLVAVNCKLAHPRYLILRTIEYLLIIRLSTESAPIHLSYQILNQVMKLYATYHINASNIQIQRTRCLKKLTLFQCYWLRAFHV